MPEGVAEASVGIGVGVTESSVGVAETEPSVGVAEGGAPSVGVEEGTAEASVGAALPVGTAETPLGEADGAPEGTGMPEGGTGPPTGADGLRERTEPGKEKDGIPPVGEAGTEPVAVGKRPPSSEAKSPPPWEEGVPLAEGKKPPRSEARSPPVEPVGVAPVGELGANMLKSPSKPLGLLGVEEPEEPVGIALLVGELGANRLNRPLRPLGLLGVGVPEAPGAATLTLLGVLSPDDDCPLLPKTSDTRVDTGPETGQDMLKGVNWVNFQLTLRSKVLDQGLDRVAEGAVGLRRSLHRQGIGGGDQEERRNDGFRVHTGE